MKFKIQMARSVILERSPKGGAIESDSSAVILEGASEASD